MPHEYLLLLFIYGVSSFLQGVVGFGFALLSVPLVATIYDPATAVAMNAIVGTANCAYKAWLLRGKGNSRWVLRFTMSAFFFVPLGVLGISSISRASALTAMGLFVLIVSILAIGRRESVSRLSQMRGSYWGVALLAGALSGAFAAPGPAVVPYFVAREDDPSAAKANLNLFFTLIALPVVLFHGVAGNLEPSSLALAAAYLPVVFLLTALGAGLAGRMNASRLQRVVDIALLLLGVWLVLDNTLI